MIEKKISSFRRAKKKSWYVVVSGRPNAGKSSLLRNLLRRDVYRQHRISTGKKPGTTRKIHCMPLLGGELIIVDLPGWGHLASRPRKLKNHLLDEVVAFLERNGPRIILALHVIDLCTFREVSQRLDEKGFIPIDFEMISFLQEVMHVRGALYVVLTKLDKFTDQRKLEAELQWARSVIPFSLPLFPIGNKGGQGLTELKVAVYGHLRAVFSKEKLQDVLAMPHAK